MEAKYSLLLHSGHLLMLSKQAYERSLQRSSDAMASIVLSTLTLECFLNELGARLENEFLHGRLECLSRLKDTLDLLEEERASLLTKIDAVHLVLIGFRIDRGCLPFQDVRFLNELRNALIHRRVERFEWEFDNSTREYEPHKFVKYLMQRGIIQRPPPTNPPSWSQYVLVPEAARWAHNTVARISRDIVSWLPEGNLKTTTSFMVGEWSQIAV